MRPSDLTNHTFGRLTAIRRIPGTATKKTKWVCLCECGITATVAADKLKFGHTKSCGCLRPDRVRETKTRHGHSPKAARSLTYKSWCNMLTRCTNPNAVNFDRYGGLGIRVCERWSNSFEAFLKDMGERPSRKHSIERLNSNKDYEPGNCCWATTDEQSVNKSITRKVVVDGREIPLAHACAEAGVKYATAWLRIQRGLPWDRNGGES